MESSDQARQAAEAINREHGAAAKGRVVRRILIDLAANDEVGERYWREVLNELIAIQGQARQGAVGRGRSEEPTERLTLQARLDRIANQLAQAADRAASEHRDTCIEAAARLSLLEQAITSLLRREEGAELAAQRLVGPAFEAPE